MPKSPPIVSAEALPATGLTPSGGSNIRQKSKSAVSLSPEEQALQDGDMLLIAKIDCLDLDAAEQLIKAGQSVNVADENGTTPMHAAVKAIGDKASEANQIFDRHMDFLCFLVEQKAFVDVKDNYENVPTNVAIDAGEQSARIVEFLVDLKSSDGCRVVNLKSKNEKKGQRDGFNLLHSAAWAGNTEATRVLLKTGEFADMLEDQNKQGQTVLHIAAFRAPKATVNLLTDAGCNHQAVENNPRSASFPGASPFF